MDNASTHTIYFGDSVVHITRERPSVESHIVEADKSGAVSRAKIVKKVETCKSITILAPDPDLTFERLKVKFKVVQAAGGVVTNERGELLMIRLRERWDLPKGHVDKGEGSLTAALREVREETGIIAQALDNEPLATTWHAYNVYGPWELKSTNWWTMRYVDGEAKPQHEEGITRVEWVASSELGEHLKSSYPTINEVMRALEKMKEQR